MREDLRKIIEDNWADIQELIMEKAEAEQKPKSVWDLKKEDGEEYYLLWADGSTVRLIFNSQDDEVLREIGKVFLTREEAEFELERRKIEAIMKKYSRPFKYDEYNYYIEYYQNDNKLDISFYNTIRNGVPYFESEEIAQKVIDKIGEDRLIKYWFGVKE